MAGEIFGAQGTEGPEPHVEPDLGSFDAGTGQFGEQAITEMEPRGRCCDRAGDASEAGLVTGRVWREGRLAVDVRGQRCFPSRFLGLELDLES